MTARGAPPRPGGIALPPLRSPADLAWQDDAPCTQADPELFFPAKGGSTRQAKRVCMACDVRAACLEYALANGERHGIWGGKSERERHRIAAGRSRGRNGLAA